MARGFAYRITDNGPVDAFTGRKVSQQRLIDSGYFNTGKETTLMVTPRVKAALAKQNNNWNQYKITQMEDSHLRNAIVFCEKQFAQVADVSVFKTIDSMYPEYAWLITEATRRGLIPYQGTTKRYGITVDVNIPERSTEDMDKFVARVINGVKRALLKDGPVLEIEGRWFPY